MTDPGPAAADDAASLHAIDILREVLMRGPILRSELTARLGISPPAVTRVTRPLIERGLLVEGDLAARRGTGRPAKPLVARADAHHYVGIKLRGQSAVGVLTDFGAGEVRSAELALPSADFGPVVAVITELVADLSAERAITGIGISVGGRVAGTTIVDHDQFLHWDDQDLGGVVQSLTGVPTIVENDVVALTAAEHWFGLARGITDFAVITIGAGIGYGLVRNDALASPLDAGVGLASHIPLDLNGPECPLGHRGCSTAMLTTQGIGVHASRVLGRTVTGAEAIELARAGDADAQRVIGLSAHALGVLIAVVGNLSMVETIVIAGEGVAILELARDQLDEAIGDWRDSRATPLDVRVDDSGFVSWARGAAAIAIRNSLPALAAARQPERDRKPERTAAVLRIHWQSSTGDP